MSGMEVVAVLGCVAAVVSAYKDGGQIVKQIKAKRAAKKVLAPTKSLESSFERGPIAVEQAKDNGIERYRPKFATGVQVATEALRNILINLQGSLLRHLWSAQEDDNVTDFHILVDASDFGRIQSVTVLADDAIASLPWKESSEMSIAEDNPWVEEPSTSNVGVKKVASPDMSPTTRTVGYMQRRQSTEATLVEEDPRPSREPKPMRRIAPYQPRKQFKSEALPSETLPKSKGTPKFPFMLRRRATPDVLPNAEQPQTLNLTATISPIISRNQTNQSAQLGSRNPYGGYCKGAYQLQVGLDKESVKLRNQSTSMAGDSHYWAYASAKCAFEGPACKNGEGKNWTFDDTVRESNALQYRWTLLAKCHVNLPKVKNGQYDYQCVFCGVHPSSVYRGEKAFIEHVSQQDRGQQPDPSISDKISCIYGRVALEEESFDVNLTSRDDSLLTHQQASVDNPDLISGFNDHNATPDEGFEWPAIENLSSMRQPSF